MSQDTSLVRLSLGELLPSSAHLRFTERVKHKRKSVSVKRIALLSLGLLNRVPPYSKVLFCQKNGTTSSDKLLENINGWKCDEWKFYLDSAKTEFDKNPNDISKLVKAEIIILERLYYAIRTNYLYGEYPGCFELGATIENGKTNCLGYTQLFYIIGNSLGLHIKAIDVDEGISGSLKQAHVTCIINLANQSIIMVDLSKPGFISQPFKLEETFSNKNDIWVIRNTNNPLKIHRKFHIWNKNGLAACIWSDRGLASILSRNYPEGISDFDKAIRLDPRYSKHYMNRGIGYMLMENYPRAISDMSKAIENDNKYAEALYFRGYLNISTGNYQEAIADLTKVIELEPKNGKAYFRRGYAYEKLKEYDAAAADYSEAKRLGYKSKRKEDPGCP